MGFWGGFEKQAEDSNSSLGKRLGIDAAGAGVSTLGTGTLMLPGAGGKFGDIVKKNPKKALALSALLGAGVTDLGQKEDAKSESMGKLTPKEGRREAAAALGGALAGAPLGPSGAGVGSGASLSLARRKNRKDRERKASQEKTAKRNVYRKTPRWLLNAEEHRGKILGGAGTSTGGVLGYLSGKKKGKKEKGKKDEK